MTEASWIKNQNEFEKIVSDVWKNIDEKNQPSTCALDLAHQKHQEQNHISELENRIKELEHKINTLENRERPPHPAELCSRDRCIDCGACENWENGGCSW